MAGPAPKENETREERFKRLAALRTQEVLERLRILGNCANPYLYDYKKADVEKIFQAIEEQAKKVKAKFTAPENETFTLE